MWYVGFIGDVFLLLGLAFVAVLALWKGLPPY
jgi:hypothetical protein